MAFVLTRANQVMLSWTPTRIVESLRRRAGRPFPQRALCHRLRQQRGSSLVEFALTLSILLLLTFGMIDLCRLVYTASAVQAAAQVGARAGLINMAQAPLAVRERLFALDANRAQVTATVVNNTQVHVQVTYSFEFITPYLSQLAPNGRLQLSSQANMAIQ